MDTPDKAAERLLNTFAAVFAEPGIGANQRNLQNILSIIIRDARSEGMKRAAVIAASHEMQNTDFDTVARDIARNILEAI